MGTGKEEVTRLFFQPVLSFEDFEFVRRVYNESLEGLATKPLKPNTLEEQLDWWFKKRSKLLVAWDSIGAKRSRVGFLMLTLHDTERGTFYTPMFAIAPEQRGKGYARQFIAKYIEEAWYSPLAGEQRKDNGAICRLNAEMGWKVVGESEIVQYLVHPGRERDGLEAARSHALWRMGNELQS